MLFVDNKNNYDPEINLAIEQYLVMNLPIEENSYLLFYINDPSIIIGKHQNTIEEINTEYVDKKNIKVVRRLSGGGAVYHDRGNLNFSFITKNDGNSFSNYQRYLNPVIKALQQMGVNAEIKGRNDILVGDKKISGNAQFATNKRMFTHGTLLFNSNMDEVSTSLKVRKDKIESKGIKSIRSRVANITDYITTELTIEEFRDKLLLSIFNVDSIKDITKYELTESDWSQIRKISQERYANWEWNFGRSPKFYMERTQRFPIGSIDLKLNVQDGIITAIKIYGDFFGVGNLEDIENKLIGKKYTKQSVAESLRGLDLSLYFGKITLEEFLTLIY
ncbi:MAG: lipoate--protein ligase [Apibacter sp.]|uniref:lipoate--protein ligase n=1 Tax=Apibacter sp. TaxID=2023709 RepID=UPI0025F7B3E7|nr:lipoate--protein ligase [Apibacter sp.]MCT6868328.1 lipoate--protein ligase [Apibacter sp.]